MKKGAFYIGLSGGLGAGKTTLARMIAFELGDYKCRIAAFGNILKSFVSAVYCIPVGILHKESGKNTLPIWVPNKRALLPEEVPRFKKFAFYVDCHPNERDINEEIVKGCVSCPMGTLTCGRLLQIVGEAFRNSSGPDFWIVQLDKFLSTAATDGDMDVVIVEDVRHENEAQWIRSKGGVIVKLAGDPPTTSCIAKRDMRHPSELGIHSEVFTEAFLGKRTDEDFCRASKEVAAKIKERMMAINDQ
jgi:hypothetical protein